MSDECKTCSRDDCPAKSQKPGESAEEYKARQALTARMCQIRHKLVVLSGKGGVGKSTVSVNLAAALARAGRKVGLLDVDIHGPSIPRLLDLEGRNVEGTDHSLFPLKVSDRLSVMSIGLLLRGANDAVIWRGPMKYNAIQQFLRDVEWGELDYLIVDCPPGTGDEPLAVVQLIGDADAAVVVTTPQDLSVADVRRSIAFCRRLELPVLGVIENMSGFTCPSCGQRVDIFGVGGGEKLAAEAGVSFLGAIPIDVEVMRSGERGQPIVDSKPDSETAKAFQRVIEAITAREEKDA
ncbi:MAG: Mrp/NBP35 family ATP-binding protein [Deltaproteobacteria bacterium]|nr:Mrp/NBP35 family ATP-binding protein [Deltaproteobacteria bacterium]